MNIAMEGHYDAGPVAHLVKGILLTGRGETWMINPGDKVQVVEYLDSQGIAWFEAPDHPLQTKTLKALKDYEGPNGETYEPA